MEENLSGTWRAWLSDSENDAIDRIPDGQYQLVNGAVIADDREDLIDGQLYAPINLSEKGGLPATSRVWPQRSRAAPRRVRYPREYYLHL